METTQTLQLGTPVSLIILPASSTLCQGLQPLTVITTTALGAATATATLGFHTGAAPPQAPALAPIPAPGVPVSVCPVVPAVAASAPSLMPVAGLPLAAAAPAVTIKAYSGTPPLKPAKKFRSEQEEILRCKRRLDFIGSLGLQRPAATTVLRRNERERNRVKLINNTFVRLREHLPGTTIKTSKGKAKKLSKVDTLQQAIDYIHALQDLIDEHDAVSAVMDGRRCSTSGPARRAAPPGDACDQLMSPGSAGEADGLSDLGGDEAPLSPEEADLLDFASWF